MSMENRKRGIPGKPDPLNLKGMCRTLDGSVGDNKRGEMENGVISPVWMGCD